MQCWLTAPPTGGMHGRCIKTRGAACERSAGHARKRMQRLHQRQGVGAAGGSDTAAWPALLKSSERKGAASAVPLHERKRTELRLIGRARTVLVPLAKALSQGQRNRHAAAQSIKRSAHQRDCKAQERARRARTFRQPFGLRSSFSPSFCALPFVKHWVCKWPDEGQARE